MPLKLYNTLSGDKEAFRTLEPGVARVYVCGPTVYDYAHVGHARCYTVYDVLVRHLRASGLRVEYVRNVTDVDDKILNRAAELGEEPVGVATRFAKAYAEDMAALGNVVPDVEPRVSDHLEDIRALIARLIDQGAAYEVDGDVYFHVKAFPDYGKLSHRDLSQLELGASGRTRAQEARRKRYPADFALWKGCDEGEVGWPSPWGRGRPGWHIECSAMSMRYLGESFDLHGGGLDLVFPHHENEIAQSEAATGKQLATFWMHNGFVEVDKQKMSKSLGNFFTARELFQRIEPEAVRYVMLTMHYRAPLHLDWTLDEEGQVSGFPQFEEAERCVEYLYRTQQRLSDLPGARVAQVDAPVPEPIHLFDTRLREALDDDLNMPVALSRLHEFLRAVNDACDQTTRKKGKVPARTVEAARKAFADLGERLGLGQQDADAVLTRIRDRRARARSVSVAAVEAQILARAQARASKDFTRADAIRQELAALGVELHDKPEGTTWTLS